MSSEVPMARFIVGPTATGKTDVAQRIAEEDGCDIVSADSMLVYKGMDIGTAKPRVETRRGVRYWGIDLVTPDRHFSVGAYREEALRAFSEIARTGRVPIVVGGTGLYVKSLTHGLGAERSPAPQLRHHLDQVLEEKGTAALREMLEKESPAMLAGLQDKSNPRRLIRAVEMARSGMKDYPRGWKERGAGPVLAGISIPRPLLHERIRRRVNEMYRGGLLEEVELLLGQYPSMSSTARQAIGYAEAIDCISGRCTREEAVQRTVQRTNQLAKRQFTWFRHQADVKWIDVDIDTGIDTIVGSIRDVWKTYGPSPVPIAESGQGA